MVGFRLRKQAAKERPHEREEPEDRTDAPAVAADSQVANSRKYAYRGSFECQ